MNQNRVIKFRVWDTLQVLFIENCHSNGGKIISGILTLDIPDYWVLQQFTGLKDRNNKEIYEGDIIKSSAEAMTKNNTPMMYDNDFEAIIRYSPPSFIIEEINQKFSYKTSIFWGGCEIIGNIFENPEF